MVNYVCPRCGKISKQKSHHEAHINRKRSCKKDNILEEIIEQKVDNQVKQHLSQQIDLKVEQKVKEILDKINQEMVSEYSQKSKKELISLCKQKGIKKLSALNKPQLIQILEDIKEDQEVQEVQIVQEGKNVYKFIDLFCGIGGFHQALTSLGCECNLACDIDAACRKVYTSNYQLEPCIDVKKIDPEMIEDMDIICGGFPCQAFSNAGNKKMFSDDRGLLFDEIIRIAKVKKPKFMFLENVKHILKVGDGEVIKYIRGKLDMNNYHVQIFQISPHQYGVPQQREWVYFVCVRKDIYNGASILLPEKKENFKFEDFLDKKVNIDPKYFIGGDILKCLEAWNEMIRLFEVGEKISPTIMINEHYNNHTQEDFDNYAGWRKDYITKNKTLIAKYKDKWDVWYEKHKEILQKREIFGKLEWQAGKIKENDSIFS